MAPHKLMQTVPLSRAQTAGPGATVRCETVFSMRRRSTVKLQLTQIPPTMNLVLLTDASPAIQWHAGMAAFAFLAGLLQLLGRKGSASHRWLGRLWVLAMVVVAGSSFGIRGIVPRATAYGLSPIHLLSVFVLVQLARGVYFARKGDFSRHARSMKGVFIGGLVIAGAFTLVPGRLLYRVFLAPWFGG